MIELFAFGKIINNFKELVASYSASEFDSPRRSTVLSLDYWRSFDHAAKTFGELVCLDFSNRIRLHFEYSTPVQAGKGKSSFTDLMLTSNAIAVAIEAKYQEPSYETVSKWLRKPHQQNRGKVLSGWISLIQSVTGVGLTLHDISSLPYQLIHRTASVCYVPAKSRCVVYQIFEPNKEDNYSEHLHALASLFQEGSTLSFSLMLCPFEPCEDYQELLDLWDEGKRELSQNVTAALTSTTLARFYEPRHVRFT